MSKTLLESGFLTVDLRSFFKITSNNSTEEIPTAAGAESTSAEDNANGTSSQAPTTLDGWGKELKRRLDANRKLSSEARIPESDIESKFFKEFFNANWDEPCAKQLVLIGEPLRKLLRVVGFNPDINPILAFLRLQYVKNNLLAPGRLNLNTFRAIYNAFVNKTVVDSQFFKENNYNLIYCPDLYKKSPKEMEEYLALQKQMLSPTATEYKANSQIKNRKIFFKVFDEPDINKHIKALSELPIEKTPTAAKATLNSIDLAKAIAKNMGITNTDTTIDVKLSNDEMTALVSKLDTVDKKMAAILALSISTDSTEAKKAIASGKFNNVDMRKVVADAIQIASSMPKGRLAKKDADRLVKTLLSEI